MFLIDKARRRFAEPVAIANDDGANSITPLSDIAETFEELAALVEVDPPSRTGADDLRLSTFCHACTHVSVLFASLGLAFKFAELEYAAKVGNLMQAPSRFSTLHDILDLDLANGTVKVHGSLSRNLRRVRQGLDLIRVLFQHFLTSYDYCLKEAASTAYAEVFAQYHTWAVRTAVSAGMYALPTREQLLIKLNETEQSAEKKMRRYIKASIPVIDYIDNLYVSRNITLDCWDGGRVILITKWLHQFRRVPETCWSHGSSRGGTGVFTAHIVFGMSRRKYKAGRASPIVL